MTSFQIYASLGKKSKTIPNLKYFVKPRTYSFNQLIYIQSYMSYVTFQMNSEIWSHKAGGCLIQV